MTYFPKNVFKNITSFIMPPPAPEGRHPIAELLHSALPLWMFAVQRYDFSVDASAELAHLNYHNYPALEGRAFTLRGVFPNLIPAPIYRQSQQEEWFSTRPLYVAKTARDEFYIHAEWARPQMLEDVRDYKLKGKNKVNAGSKFKTLTNKHYLTKYLTQNGIPFKKSMKKADLLRLCLSF